MAIEFDGSGSGQHIDFGNLDLPEGLTQLTILMWVKFNSFTLGDQRIISKATSHSVQDHWFMFSGNNSNQMRARLKTGGSTTTHYENSSTINIGQWYHMGFVYNGSNIIFYRDGAQGGSSSKTGTINTSASVGVHIADNPGTDRKELDGSIEDCRIYKRALSIEEIQTIYTANGHDDILYNLVHRWLLDERSDGIVASGSDSIVDLMGTTHGSPVSNPYYRISERSFGRR